jgi:outer membrane receptor for ferrienterochelin and colicins
MLLNEIGGMRVQTTSPALGAASVRVQGMRGRYAAFLSDGLPLFGQQGAGLGLLQIPPMDLAQVEVIKSDASALYGSAAMVGVINLISRRPEDKPGFTPANSRTRMRQYIPGRRLIQLRL